MVSPNDCTLDMGEATTCSLIVCGTRESLVNACQHARCDLASETNALHLALDYTVLHRPSVIDNSSIKR